ncbi:SDR family NAD(P)-dependent oxidoreductase [Sphingomonas sp. BN140010]|uniref:SDR family NAD(P)-dependent oxidoreductase n=1 Tax=Sphingomonas arvum TaxID=2992113 RepID=A0ABT3JBV1_9SPHN|nr:SDR family NAD(P)-dependent oxidoreductase [Sphingomonas sp. BN140010]MCW3796545.1 SDR family NAD(P)-dependent oxidoreductase [Sphingomonas sp. BN140010]
MSAIVIGASGGIGSALADLLSQRGPVVRLSRSAGDLDLLDESSIAAAAARLAGQAPFARIIVATGLLHDDRQDPERSLRDLSAEHLQRSFAINAIGPVLCLRHFLPLLAPDGRFAALSARVGSISDNRLGGWYGYRAAKAALNQLVRTAAIELARTRREAVCVTLHPGTVDTAMSRPFQRGVAPDKLFTPVFAAERLLAVLDALTAADSGSCFDWAGTRVPF